MNIKKISIGLLFLILALVVVPGASAAPSDHPMMFPPATHAGEATCVACHEATSAELSNGLGLVTCASCHIDPATKNEHPAGMAPPTTAAGEVSCTNCHI